MAKISCWLARNTSGKCFPSTMLLVSRWTRDLWTQRHSCATAGSQSDAYDQSTQFVTAPDTVEGMRRVARVYQLHPNKDQKALQRWSAHSLRVGAYVILPSIRISTTQIKLPLRWRALSPSWLAFEMRQS
jgi:hypothetical protein